MPRRDFIKLLGAAVLVALLTTVMLEMWLVSFSYPVYKTAVISIQREQADATATKIGQFITEIVNQVCWTTQLPWSVGTMEQRRFDAMRLLQQVPAVTEIAFLDASGTEQVNLSRLVINPVLKNPDRSQDPAFTEAVAHKVYFGPVYFRRESEPYMTLSLAGKRRESGVSVAMVSLKLVWDVVSSIKVGERGDAYLVDAQGRLIAHSDISLVLRNTDIAKLWWVQAARRVSEAAPTEQVQVAQDVQGREVLTAYALVTPGSPSLPLPPLGWLVFVELPSAEAYGPLYSVIKHSFGPLLAGLTLAFFGIAWFSGRSRRGGSAR